MSIQLEEAIFALCPNAKFSIIGYDYSGIKWRDERTQPTEAEIETKLAELTAAEPLRQLRIQRNQLLAATDWRMTTDYPYSDQAEWASYRTSLRNLPESAEPTLDENGQLTNVDWPTAPSEV